MGFDPISLAVGATQTGQGLLQSLFSGRKKNEKKFNAQIDKSPKVAANSSIMDYYNSALQRYNVNPTSSALYKRQQQNIGRSVATGLSGFQDRRSGQGGISSLLRGANDASLNAEVAAEQLKNQRFSQLGGATQMKSSDDRYVFDQNELTPFNLKTQLAGMKLAASNETYRAGLTNAFNGVQTGLNGYTPKKK